MVCKTTSAERTGFGFQLPISEELEESNCAKSASKNISTAIKAGHLKKNDFLELLAANAAADRIVISENQSVPFKSKHLIKVASSCHDALVLKFKPLYPNAFTEITDHALLQVVKQLPKLQEIYLEGCCKLTGDGLQEALNKATILTALSLNNQEQLSSITLNPILNQNPNLQVLSLNGFDERFNESTLGCIAQLAQLKKLELMSGISIFTGEQIAHFVQTIENQGFEKLILNCGPLNDTIVKMIAMKNPDISFLRLGGCAEITRESLDVIAKHCKKIKTLSLADCPDFCIEDVKHLLKEGYLDCLDLLVIEEKWYSKKNLAALKTC
jgi:hypothetical protein